MDDRRLLEGWLIERGWRLMQGEKSAFRWAGANDGDLYQFEDALARQLREDAVELIKGREDKQVRDFTHVAAGALLYDLLMDEARASVALDHDPQYQTMCSEDERE